MREDERERPVTSLASQALSVLASIRSEDRVAFDPALADALRDAVLSHDAEARSRMMQLFRDHAVSDMDIVDVYIPHAARRLGEDWCNDDIGFADTSIGAARLQHMLRDLTPATAANTDAAGDGSGIAVIVMADDTHTLGAMILTSQLRRMGISVRVFLGTRSEEALDAVGTDRYDAVFLSVSQAENLGKLRKFVETLRKQTQRNMPVVVGGRAAGFVKNVRAELGADFATSDPAEAVRLCGLKVSAEERKRRRR